VVAGALARSCEKQGIELAMPYDDAAGALLSLGIGLGLQRSLSAELPVHLLSDVVRVIAGLPLPARRA
jgi:hypothetical protein